MGVLNPPAIPSRFNRGGLASAQPAATPALAGVTWTYSDVGSATYSGRVDRCDGSTWVMIVPPSGTNAPLATGTDTGIHKNTDSPTYGTWFTIGNKANSAGFAGTGSPAEAYGPFVLYHQFGLNAAQTDVAATNVKKTTQGFFGLVSYWRATDDDSAEAGSIGVFIKDNTGLAGGAAFNQTKQISGWEAIAQLEGPNTALVGDSAPMNGMVSRTMVTSGAHAATVVGFKASHNPGITPGTTDKYVGFWQPVASGATAAYGVYTVDKIASETGFSLGASGATASLNALLAGSSDTDHPMLTIQGPDASNPGLAQVLLRAGSTQTKAMLIARDTGGTNRLTIGFNGFVTHTNVGENWNNGSSVLQVSIVPSTGITLAGGNNIILDTATGTKIGTGTTQKLGFFNATPIVQPSGTPAAATDLASVISLADSLRTNLLALGLVA